VYFDHRANPRLSTLAADLQTAKIQSSSSGNAFEQQDRQTTLTLGADGDSRGQQKIASAINPSGGSPRVLQQAFAAPHFGSQVPATLCSATPALLLGSSNALELIVKRHLGPRWQILLGEDPHPRLAINGPVCDNVRLGNDLRLQPQTDQVYERTNHLAAAQEGPHE